MDGTKLNAIGAEGTGTTHTRGAGFCLARPSEHSVVGDMRILPTSRVVTRRTRNKGRAADTMQPPAPRPTPTCQSRLRVVSELRTQSEA